jgi:hypothetical protein
MWRLFLSRKIETRNGRGQAAHQQAMGSAEAACTGLLLLPPAQAVAREAARALLRTRFGKKERELDEAEARLRDPSARAAAPELGGAGALP